MTTVEERQLNVFMVWYWIKWGLMLIFKLVIDIPFMICGPIMAILQWRGLTAYPIEGIFLCCVISLFVIPDQYYTIIIPWKGTHGGDFPVWMEDWRSAKDERHHEMTYITVWSKI